MTEQFLRKHRKIVLLAVFLTYGISLYHTVYFVPILNYGAVMIMIWLHTLFFRDPSMHQYEWLTFPILNAISNLIFWSLVVILIDKYGSKFWYLLSQK